MERSERPRCCPGPSGCRPCPAAPSCSAPRAPGGALTPTGVTLLGAVCRKAQSCCFSALCPSLSGRITASLFLSARAARGWQELELAALASGCLVRQVPVELHPQSSLCAAIEQQKGDAGVQGEVGTSQVLGPALANLPSRATRSRQKRFQSRFPSGIDYCPISCAFICSQHRRAG